MEFTVLFDFDLMQPVDSEFCTSLSQAKDAVERSSPGVLRKGDPCGWTGCESFHRVLLRMGCSWYLLIFWKGSTGFHVYCSGSGVQQ